MKKRTNKILSILLAMVMVMTAMPIIASANAATIGRQLINAKNNFTCTQKNINYDGSTLKKGTKVAFDTPLYTVTVEITKANGTELTAQATIDGKIGDKDGYEVCLDHSWLESGTLDKGRTCSYTFNTDEIYGGTHYLIVETTTLFADIVGDHSDMSIDDFIALRDKFGAYYEAKHYLCFGVKEKVVLYGFNNATKNSVTFADKAWEPHNEYGKDIGYPNIKASGTVVYYKESSQKKWKSKKFKSGSDMKITGLKADKKYKFKCKYYTTIVNPADSSKTVTTYSDYFNTYVFRTASSKPLKVKSIKAGKSKIKTVHREAYWYWSSSNQLQYVPAKTSKYRVYKVTVNVSNLPKNTQGILVSVDSDSLKGGRFVKLNGKKKKYTVTIEEPAKTKGKKRNVKVYAVANNMGTYGIGKSPAAKKTFNIKK